MVVVDRWSLLEVVVGLGLIVFVGPLLLLSKIGKRVFKYKHNLICLVPILQRTGETEAKSKIKKERFGRWDVVGPRQTSAGT